MERGVLSGKVHEVWVLTNFGPVLTALWTVTDVSLSHKLIKVWRGPARLIIAAACHGLSGTIFDHTSATQAGARGFGTVAMRQPWLCGKIASCVYVCTKVSGYKRCSSYEHARIHHITLMIVLCLGLLGIQTHGRGNAEATSAQNTPKFAWNNCGECGWCGPSLL